MKCFIQGKQTNEHVLTGYQLSQLLLPVNLHCALRSAAGSSLGVFKGSRRPQNQGQQFTAFRLQKIKDQSL